MSLHCYVCGAATGEGYICSQCPRVCCRICVKSGKYAFYTVGKSFRCKYCRIYAISGNRFQIMKKELMRLYNIEMEYINGLLNKVCIEPVSKIVFSSMGC